MLHSTLLIKALSASIITLIMMSLATVTIAAEYTAANGIYIGSGYITDTGEIKGELPDGITYNTDEKTLTLNNYKGSAIVIIRMDKVTIDLKGASQIKDLSYTVNGEEIATEAGLFTDMTDITFTGRGSLEIKPNGGVGIIAGKCSLKFERGNVRIVTDEGFPAIQLLSPDADDTINFGEGYGITIGGNLVSGEVTVPSGISGDESTYYITTISEGDVAFNLTDDENPTIICSGASTEVKIESTNMGNIESVVKIMATSAIAIAVIVTFVVHRRNRI